MMITPKAEDNNHILVKKKPSYTQVSKAHCNFSILIKKIREAANKSSLN